MKPWNPSINRWKKRKINRKGRSLLSNCSYLVRRHELSVTRDKDLDVVKAKRVIRSYILDKRLGLSDKYITEESRKITTLLLRSNVFQKASRIALYYPIRNEVKSQAIFAEAKKFGKEVYLPVVKGKILKFHKTTDLDDLVEGKFGVPQPEINTPELSVHDLDLIIIPGVAFDFSGGRLGYGMGFYDRSFLEVNYERIVGLVYDFQVLNSVPQTFRDITIGYLVTNNGGINCLRSTRRKTK